jgi:release factor glutamine methyltransferase
VKWPKNSIVKKTLWQMTQEVALFFEKHKENITRDQAWHQGKLYIQGCFDLTPLEWLSGLHDTSYPYERLNALFERKDIAFTPLSRLLGYRWFYDHKFYLNEETLDPRWETEEIVSLVLEQGRPKKILDLGTGSGCLLISLLHALPQAVGLGVDISTRALDMARENAERIGVAHRAQWIKSHWCERIVGKFDCIVANPPYIESGCSLPCEVTSWDPLQALYGGPRGTEAYEEIIPSLPLILEKEGEVILEIGSTQAQDVSQILARTGFNNINLFQDRAGKDRYIRARECVLP